MMIFRSQSLTEVHPEQKPLFILGRLSSFGAISYVAPLKILLYHLKELLRPKCCKASSLEWHYRPEIKLQMWIVQNILDRSILGHCNWNLK